MDSFISSLGSIGSKSRSRKIDDLIFAKFLILFSPSLGFPKFQKWEDEYGTRTNIGTTNGGMTNVSTTNVRTTNVRTTNVGKLQLKNYKSLKRQTSEATNIGRDKERNIFDTKTTNVGKNLNKNEPF